MSRPLHLVGRRFGRLLVVSEAPSREYPCGAKRRHFNCVCDCGTGRVVAVSNLTRGGKGTKSCGCINRDRFKALCAGKTGIENPKWKGGRQASRRRLMYGIEPDEWNDMFERQGRCCAICRTTTPGGRFNAWNTDHDHQTGKVRGILCARCNRMAAVFY